MTHIVYPSYLVQGRRSVEVFLYNDATQYHRVIKANSMPYSLAIAMVISLYAGVD